MRTPQKSRYISQLLRERIIRRYYAPGEQLPHEIDLAEDLGISRNTLRAALTSLEEDKLLTRIKGKGTFVAERKKPLITLLLPCENFLLQENKSAFLLRQIYTGVFRAVRDFDCRLETIAVSATNTPEGITSGCLDSIGQDSLVIFSSTWFESLFQQVHERGARISLLDGQLLRPNLFPFTADWNIVDFNVSKEIQNATELLYLAGCRRIAFASVFVRRQDYPTLTGYRNGRNIGNLPDLSILCRDDEPEYNIRKIRSEYEKKKFDGLIINSNLVLQDNVSLHEYLGLPDHVRIFISDYSGYRPLPDDVYAYGSRNPVDAGYNAVKALFDTTQARHIVYDSEIHILEKIQQVNYA